MSWNVLNPDQAAGMAPITTPVALIGLNGFEVSANENLYTIGVSVCSGIALLPKTPGHKAGLLHTLSNPEHLHYSDDKIRAHAQCIWDDFEKALDPKGEYHAVIFGGTDKGTPESARISHIMNDLMHANAIQAGYVTSHEDHRFTPTVQGLSAIVNPAAREFAFGEPYHFEEAGALDVPSRPGQKAKTLLPSKYTP